MAAYREALAAYDAIRAARRAAAVCRRRGGGGRRRARVGRLCGERRRGGAERRGLRPVGRPPRRETSARAAPAGSRSCGAAAPTATARRPRPTTTSRCGGGSRRRRGGGGRGPASASASTAGTRGSPSPSASSGAAGGTTRRWGCRGASRRGRIAIFRGRRAGEGGLRELAALGLGVAAGLVAAGLGGGGGHAERERGGRALRTGCAKRQFVRRRASVGRGPRELGDFVAGPPAPGRSLLVTPHPHCSAGGFATLVITKVEPRAFEVHRMWLAGLALALAPARSARRRRRWRPSRRCSSRAHGETRPQRRPRCSTPRRSPNLLAAPKFGARFSAARSRPIRLPTPRGGPPTPWSAPPRGGTPPRALSPPRRPPPTNIAHLADPPLLPDPQLPFALPRAPTGASGC